MKGESSLAIFVRIFVLALCGLGLASCSDDNPEGAHDSTRTELVVMAAASLQEPLTQIQVQYESLSGSSRLVFAFGSSGTLQRQIEQGAPADLFLSASLEVMDALERNQRIEAEDRVPLLTNELVVVVPAVKGKQKPTALFQLEELADERRFGLIAIGVPDLVPVGSYAREVLQRANLWHKLEPRLVYAKDASQALTYVETGNADAGIVYRSDASRSDKSELALIIEPSTHSPIVYPMAILKDTKHREAVERFYTYLLSNAASSIFQDYGFGRAALP